MTCAVELGNDKVAYIDDEDASAVRRHIWTLKKGYQTDYAWSWIDGRQVHLHQFVLQHYTGEPIDHENHNGLDNRKRNLVITTTSRNCINRTIPVGVNLFRRGDTIRYHATLSVDGERFHLGSFESEHHAQRVAQMNRARVSRGLRPIGFIKANRWAPRLAIEL